MKTNGSIAAGILTALLGLVALDAAPVWAQQAGDMGAGVVVGDPTGLTGKYWLSDTHALDLGLGFSDAFTVNADYLWHSWNVFPAPSQGKLPAYLGLGVEVRAGSDRHRDDGHDGNAGIRAVAGLAYWLPRNPVEIYLELAPVIWLGDDAGVGIDVGLGLRYYFTMAK